MRPGDPYMFQSMKPLGARELLHADGEAIVVDVRTTQEFEAGHIPGAYNVPIAFAGAMGMSPNPEFSARIEALFPRDKRIVFS